MTESKQARRMRIHRTESIALALVFSLHCAMQEVEQAPDFASIADTDERKLRFFCYLAPMIADKNAQLIQQRKQLQKIRKKAVHSL